MQTTETINADRVLCGVTARSKKHALEILSTLLAAGPTRRTAAEIFAELSNRERLGSTSLGNGAAIPHCRDNELEDATAALVILTAPIDFDTAEDEGVDVILGVLLPATEARRALDALTRALSERDCIGMLRRANAPDTVCTILATRLTEEQDASASTSPP